MDEVSCGAFTACPPWCGASRRASATPENQTAALGAAAGRSAQCKVFHRLGQLRGSDRTGAGWATGAEVRSIARPSAIRQRPATIMMPLKAKYPDVKAKRTAMSMHPRRLPSLAESQTFRRFEKL